MASKFLVIEGIDGVGKTTIGKIVANKLNYEFIDSLPDPFAKRYSEFYHELDPGSFYLFMLAQLSHLSEKIKELREKGKGVVITRYFPTTVAYAVANSMYKNFPTQYSLHPLRLGIEIPSAIFYLSVDNDERKRRLELKGKKDLGDTLSFNNEYTDNLLRQFDKFEMISINATSLAPEMIANKIIKELDTINSHMEDYNEFKKDISTFNS